MSVPGTQSVAQTEKYKLGFWRKIIIKVSLFCGFPVDDVSVLLSVIDEGNIAELNRLIKAIVSLPNTSSIIKDIEKSNRTKTLYFVNEINEFEVNQIRESIEFNSKIKQLDAVDDVLLLINALKLCKEFNLKNFDSLLIQKTKQPILCLLNGAIFSTKDLLRPDLELMLEEKYQDKSSGVSIFIESTAAKDYIIRSVNFNYTMYRASVVALSAICYFGRTGMIKLLRFILETMMHNKHGTVKDL